MYVYRFQNVVLCFLCFPTPRLHCFLSSHWPSCRFLSFVAFLIPSIQFFFGLPRALFCFGIHFNAIFGNLPSAILWTWPYHVSWFCSISFIIASSNPICCLIVAFLILSFLDILEDLLRASISVASTGLLLFSVSLHVSEPYNKLLLINALYILLVLQVGGWVDGPAPHHPEKNTHAKKNLDKGTVPSVVYLKNDSGPAIPLHLHVVPAISGSFIISRDEPVYSLLISIASHRVTTVYSSQSSFKPAAVKIWLQWWKKATRSETISPDTQSLLGGRVAQSE